MDLDRAVAWKQGLIYFFGLVFVILGLVLAFVFEIAWAGMPVNILGLILLIVNLVSTFWSEQHAGVKVALLIPKILFFLILFGGSFFFFFMLLTN
ncbi:MAG: hypothetical protein ACQERU_13650 [Bacteroidota bacterium]